MNATDLLDAAMRRAGLPSDYALAARLGVTRGAVSHWRTGRSAPDAAAAAALAELAGLDPDAAVAWMQAARCADDDTRRVWQRIAARLQAAAAVLLAVMVSVVIAWPADAWARGVAPAARLAPAHVIQLTKLMIAAVVRFVQRVMRLVDLALQGRPAVPIWGVPCCT